MANNNSYEIQKKQLAELLGVDMSGFDPAVHGDYNENLAEYLLANHVKVLPCEIGDKYYRIVTKRPRKDLPYFSFIRECSLSWYNIDRVWADLGKTVFLDEEKAREELEKIKKEENKEEKKDEIRDN